MTKTKNINPQSPLVVSGYILFALLIIAVLLDTIPRGIMLFDPRVLHYNVALFMVALIVGSLLPVFLAYVIGGHSVKSRSKLSHHFNGMLFGLLALWVMSIFTVIVTIPSEYFATSLTARVILVNSLPIIVVTIIASILAIAHARSRQAKRDILEYKPYSILLIGSIILLPVWSLVNNIFMQSVGIYSFLPLIIMVVLGVVSYATLRNSKLNVFTKITWSAVSVSVAYAAVFVLSPFITSLSLYINERPSAEFMAIESNTVWVGALIVWIIIWRAQAKSLSKK
ncbi:hypothetical protein H7X69_01420 [Candidatus Saccharibacteria bacterium]|nr:hypothetical protein [Candidatus Saccharibacteria bacterium]